MLNVLNQALRDESYLRQPFGLVMHNLDPMIEDLVAKDVRRAGVHEGDQRSR